MTAVDIYVKATQRTSSGSEILEQSPGVLRGVDTEAESLLKDRFSIQSVFDLAYSQIFGAARVLVEAVDGLTVFHKYGDVPADLVDNDAAALESLPEESPKVLRGVSDTTADEIKTHLDITTVRDLASWPPYVAARRIAQEALEPEELPGFDPESPPDLLPKTGDYPTERVTYQSLVLHRVLAGEVDEDSTTRRPARPGNIARRGGAVASMPAIIEEEASANAKARNLRATGPLRLRDLDAARKTLPLAEGALLTFSHSWFAQGLTLGHLLHSVALAPGETTRIAMIDWSRRTGASQTEQIDQAEELKNTTAHTRAISEVTNAVAHETQSGESETGATSSTTEFGAASASLLAVPGVPTVATTSFGTAATKSSGWGWSKSSGSRDVATEMSQRISDATQQAASAARSRRASVIREVSQAESEKVTTRAITNYNHMHALSVQYYEVVQLYRTILKLDRAERCLFIPVETLDFSDPALLRRYRDVVARAALDLRLISLLALDVNDIALTAPPLHEGTALKGPWNVADCQSAARTLRHPVGPDPRETIHLPVDAKFMPIFTTGFPEGATLTVSSDNPSLMMLWVRARFTSGVEWIKSISAPTTDTWPKRNTVQLRGGRGRHGRRSWA